MNVRIQPSALADLRAGFSFYEKQEAGLGGYFLETIFSEIDSLKLHAGIHSIHFRRFHRMLSKRFPYAVYYLMLSGEIAVFAVLDLRRDPKWIARKMNML